MEHDIYIDIIEVLNVFFVTITKHHDCPSHPSPPVPTAVAAPRTGAADSSFGRSFVPLFLHPPRPDPRARACVGSRSLGRFRWVEYAGSWSLGLWSVAAS